MNDKRVEPIEADDIYQLADAINEFSKTHNVIYSQVFPMINKYEALIGYEINKPENIYKKEEVKKPIAEVKKEPEQEEPMTSKQWGKLKSLGVNPPKGISKREAMILIKERVGN